MGKNIFSTGYRSSDPERKRHVALIRLSRKNPKYVISELEHAKKMWKDYNEPERVKSIGKDIRWLKGKLKRVV